MKFNSVQYIKYNVAININEYLFQIEKYPELMDLFHSLDIWQKAKKLSKALHQVCRESHKPIFTTQHLFLYIFLKNLISSGGDSNCFTIIRLFILVDTHNWEVSCRLPSILKVPENIIMNM